MRSNDAEHLVQKVGNHRSYNGKRLLPSQMLWQCTNDNCQSIPKIQRRGQYKDKTLCNSCSNKLKIQNPEFLIKRGKAISKAISNLGDKWSDTAKRNMSNLETRDKISKSIKKNIQENYNFAMEVRKKTALSNNKTSGFGTPNFSSKIWKDYSEQRRQGRISKAAEGIVKYGKEDHIRLMKERCSDFKLLEYGSDIGKNGLNTYECPVGHKFEMLSNNFIKRFTCPECSPKSSPEIDLLNWIKEFLPDVQHNKRVLFLDETLNGNRALEIDIYSEIKKFGIEVHGVYHHRTEIDSENTNIAHRKNSRESGGVSRVLHRYKAELAKKQGIALLQFFDDEILHKENIVKSMILSKLGKSTKFFARECEVVEIDSYTAQEFLNSNHLQGTCRSFMDLALKRDGKILSILGLRKPRGKWAEGKNVEIARFCNLLGSTVVGGFAKLLFHAEKRLSGMDFENIITYADRRYSEGKLYGINGFDFIHFTDVDFYWAKNGIRYDRHISWGKTDEEMRTNGYYKVYGAGNSFWIKKIKKP